MTVHYNKDRARWTYDFRRAGKRFQGYCLDAHGEPVSSKSAAFQAEGVARRRAEMAPKVADSRDVTLSQVIVSMTPRWRRQNGWEDKKRYAKEIRAFLGGGTAMRAIGQDRITDYVNFALSQPLKVWIGGPGQDADRDDERLWRVVEGRYRAPNTVNKYLSLLRQIIGRAAEIRDQNGRSIMPERPKVEDLPKPKRRARPTPEPVLQKLMDILPAHLVDAVVLTLSFGFRQGEAFGLTEDNVDWLAQGVRLYAEDVKDAEDTFLPASQETMGYLRSLAIEADARGVRHLISYRQETKKKAEQKWRPIASPKTAWKTAMDKIQEEFGRRWRWHDLRAAYITHVAMSSGSIAAKALARHSNFSTTEMYIEVADEQRRVAAERAGQRPALAIIRGHKG